MADVISSSVPKNYDPLKDQEYMSPYMRRHFKEKLRAMLKDLIDEENDLRLNQKEYPVREADHVDQSKTIEEAKFQEYLSLGHEEYLKEEVERALERIEAGTYGYCEETGEAIGVKRLLAFPMARYTTKVQQEKESLYR